MRQPGISSTRGLVDRAGGAEVGTDTARRRLRFPRFGGAAAISGALLAVAGNAVVRSAEPQVPADIVSYPLSVQAFQLGQVFFALTQLLMALGIIALARLGVAGHGRSARVGALLAVIGFLLTVPGELVLALVADAPIDSTPANVASSVFGLAVLLADSGLVLLGIAALRAALWPRRWAALLVALGLFELLVGTPVTLSAGFASDAAFVVITVHDLLVALLGFRLLWEHAGRPQASSTKSS